ncbi:MAG: GspH/FimT family pseudopilin [Collimonas sp.]|uniref:GspH/FimT family pseudopilin n=1 Tax=Collimonas sp. TaxID=1963772 RepID=UPI00326428FC
MTPSPSEIRGFSLIELMVTIAVAAILMGVAIPSFTTWIQNTKIRSTAETLQNGIRLAKIEAVRRSRLVDFRLTSLNPEKDAITSASGTNWYVQQHSALLDSDTSDANYNLYVQGSSVTAANVTVTLSPATSPGVATLTFNSLGRLENAGAAVYAVDIDIPKGSYRKLRVLVTQSGQIRMCDPQITFSTSTPTGC